MKTVLTFDGPDIFANGDINKSTLQKIVSEFRALSKIKCRSIFYKYGSQVNLEKNSLYVGCTVATGYKTKYGYHKFLNSSWRDVSQNELRIVNIPPGDFTIYMDYNGVSVNMFSHYKDINSIAMQDVFYLLIGGNSDDPMVKKIKMFVKSLFASVDSVYEDFKLTSKHIEEALEEIKEIGMGGDPEFSVIAQSDENNFVNAITVTKCGTDYKIGSDGHSSVLELRPKTSKNIDEFINNIEELVIETSEFVDDSKYEILTGGGYWRGESLGGHIHFSNINPDPDLISMLDTYIGTTLRECAHGRRADSEGSYDQLSQYRAQSYGDGSVKGFEYRTPPSFYTNEKFCKAVYIIANLVAKTYLLAKRTQKVLEYDTVPCLENYKILNEYEKYKDYIDYFWNFVNTKTSLKGKVFANWKVNEKKEKLSKVVPITKSGDLHLDCIKLNSLKLYKPPFKKINFYGIAEKNCSVSAINIDSYYINSNVNVGWLNKYVRDYVSDSCIFDVNLKQDNVDEFIQTGILSIGLSLRFREKFIQLDEKTRSEFISTFIRRLSHFVRNTITDNEFDIFDESIANEKEIKERNLISLYIKTN